MMLPTCFGLWQFDYRVYCDWVAFHSIPNTSIYRTHQYTEHIIIPNTSLYRTHQYTEHIIIPNASLYRTHHYTEHIITRCKQHELGDYRNVNVRKWCMIELWSCECLAFLLVQLYWVISTLHCANKHLTLVYKFLMLHWYSQGKTYPFG